MKNETVTVAEGKKGFSRLIREAMDKNEEIVVTKRGKPVAVILSYEEYQRSKRMKGYRKIAEARAEFAKSGIRSDEVFRESREQLEKKI
jgi:prevent-host-death family protein